MYCWISSLISVQCLQFIKHIVLSNCSVDWWIVRWAEQIGGEGANKVRGEDHSVTLRITPDPNTMQYMLCFVRSFLLCCALLVFEGNCEERHSQVYECRRSLGMPTNHVKTNYFVCMFRRNKLLSQVN